MDAGLSPSFEEQVVKDFAHPPEFYLRASTPQRQREEKKKRDEAAANGEVIGEEERDTISEDYSGGLSASETMMRPKVR